MVLYLDKRIFLYLGENHAHFLLIITHLNTNMQLNSIIQRTDAGMNSRKLVQFSDCQ